ncbi:MULTISPECIES: hypothetical protein [Streptomyces]|uniref:Uncharacterized protein n=1 Tax=Streptomyces odorifer TaxID=53450 RepID=A0A7Y6C6Y6_9ACTN|nr:MULTISPECIES: hypothetical protein [Streptomyces]NUV33763.1 hypothetical protein [Streptomyces sp. KAI-27]NUV45367.1 hypothetical protein [Streptomyces sp. CAI-78]MBL0779592.1 hypothetical protein [Streptomyces albidoflavus]MBV1954760.1 hypothetical protein [Streptomyces sp. BV333]MCG5122717.1 hypothetical protein [Streptomyces sp. T7(2022)]
MRADLILPILVLAAALTAAVYTYRRRKRRVSTRTTPAGTEIWGAGGDTRTPVLSPAEALEQAEDAIRVRAAQVAAASPDAPPQALIAAETALTTARTELAEARRQWAKGENPAAVREHSARADAALQAEAPAFSALRRD